MSDPEDEQVEAAAHGREVARIVMPYTRGVAYQAAMQEYGNPATRQGFSFCRAYQEERETLERSAIT